MAAILDLSYCNFVTPEKNAKNAFWIESIVLVRKFLKIYTMVTMDVIFVSIFT